MSDNFQRYEAFTPEARLEPDTGSGVRINEYSSVTKVSVLDGVMTDVSQGHIKVNSGELNPHAGTSSVLATAHHPSGLPVTEILPTTLVEIDGVQAPVSFWVNEGRLQKAADGSYTEASGAPQVAPQVVSEPLPESDMALIAEALDGMAEQNVDSLIATGVSIAIGTGDEAALLNKFQQITGRDFEDANARLAVARGAFQGQADKAMQDIGVSAEDTSDFWGWARANHPSRLQDAIGKHVHGQNLDGYRTLAAQWFTAVAPSMAGKRLATPP